MNSLYNLAEAEFIDLNAALYLEHYCALKHKKNKTEEEIESIEMYDRFTELSMSLWIPTRIQLF